MWSMLWRTPYRGYGKSSVLSACTEQSCMKWSGSCLVLPRKHWRQCRYGSPALTQVLAGVQWPWSQSKAVPLKRTCRVGIWFWKPEVRGLTLLYHCRDCAITFLLYTPWEQKQLEKHLDLESHTGLRAKLLGWEKLWEDSEKHWSTWKI